MSSKYWIEKLGLPDWLRVLAKDYENREESKDGLLQAAATIATLEQENAAQAQRIEALTNLLKEIYDSQAVTSNRVIDIARWSDDALELFSAQPEEDKS